MLAVVVRPGFWMSTQVSNGQVVHPSARYHVMAGSVTPTESVPSTRLPQYIALSQTMFCDELSSVETSRSSPRSSFRLSVTREFGGTLTGSGRGRRPYCVVLYTMLTVASTLAVFSMRMKVSKPQAVVPSARYQVWAGVGVAFTVKSTPLLVPVGVT